MIYEPKILEHSYTIPDWGKTICEECLKGWKDYVWTMKTERH